MNLITDTWIPVNRLKGPGRIAPWQITETLDSNPVLAIDAPRPDYNGALMQFVIGLLQTAFAPKGPIEWRDLYDEPPTSQALRAAFAPIAHAFELDGDGPRFLQDRGLQTDQGEPTTIAALLIDNPGGQTLRNNADHFVKRGRTEAFAPAVAAMALLTLQLNAPSGGAGHRTSLRGGGPLTTLILPDPKYEPEKNTLWHKVWLNVLPTIEFDSLSGNGSKVAPEEIFPWLGPTRTSGKGGQNTTPADVNPLQMYWGMPRRIWLDFDTANEGTCDLTGETGSVVRQYATRNYGTNYTGPWQHPLSPHYFDKDGMPLPMHPQPGGFTFRHWLDLALGQTGQTTTAANVRIARTGGEYPKRTLLHAFGYDMDNMKARCWYESLLPLLHLEHDHYEEFVNAAKDLVETADIVSRNTLSAVRNALFGRVKAVSDKGKISWQLSDATKKADKVFFQTVKSTFWQRTENEFFDRLDQIHRSLKQGESPDSTLQGWHDVLCRTAQQLFDTHVLNGVLEQEDPRAIALANRELNAFNNVKRLRSQLRLPTTKAA